MLRFLRLRYANILRSIASSFVKIFYTADMFLGNVNQQAKEITLSNKLRIKSNSCTTNISFRLGETWIKKNLMSNLTKAV